MAHLTISSGDLFRNSELALEIWSAVISILLLVEKNTVAPIAEAFAGISFLHETHKDGAQFGFNLGFLDHVFPDAVQARAGRISAEPDLIASRRLADERKFRHVRPRAAVRAAGRANDYFFAAEADFVAQFFDAV